MRPRMVAPSPWSFQLPARKPIIRSGSSDLLGHQELHQFDLLPGWQGFQQTLRHE